MILNQSRWSIVEPITKSSKDALLQELVLEEVIIRRETNLKAFRRGLSVLKITDLLDEYPDLMRVLFVAGDSRSITSHQFVSLIGCKRPENPQQGYSYDIFMEFVAHIEGKYMCTYIL